jgi:hypothetical protein
MTLTPIPQIFYLVILKCNVEFYPAINVSLVGRYTLQSSEVPPKSPELYPGNGICV